MDIKQLYNIFFQIKENEEIMFDLEKKPLGTGGSATVYPITYTKKGMEPEEQVLKVIDIVQLAEKSVEDNNLRQAIKKEKWELYQRELEINKNITACRCEHLIRIYDTYKIGLPTKDICLCAIRMPYYETLEALCQKKDALDEKTVIRLGTHICEALSVLHYDAKEDYYRASNYRIGIMLHMDIKPSNIFYRQRGEDLIFMLGDFGTLVDKSKGEVVGGTIGFLAPELSWLLDEQSEQEISEDATPAETSDIFALGMTLFYCLAEPDTKKYWDAKCNGTTVTKPGNCSDELWKVIEKATDKDPAKRYQTAEEMKTALQNVDTQKVEVVVRKNKKLTRDKIILGGTLAISVGMNIWKVIQEKNKIKEKNKINEQLHYGSNGTYEGEVKDNHPHGQGIYVYRYGEEQRILNGNWRWVEEKVVLSGVEILYTGMKCDEEYSGFAMITIPNQGIYEGNVNKLCFEEGTLKREDGSVYTGTWKKNEEGLYCPHGVGIYTDEQGNEMAGEWNEGKFIEK